MYSKNAEYFPLDVVNCDLTHSLLATCYVPQVKQNNKCLQNFENCSPIQTTCKTQYSYDSAGILITTKNNITAFQNEGLTGEKSIKNIPTTKLGTAFLPWKNVDYVQIGELFVEQPNLITSALTMHFENKLLSKWAQIMNTTSLEAIKLNTSNILSEIKNSKIPAQKLKSNSTLLYIALTLALLPLAVLIPFFCYTKVIPLLKIKFAQSHNTYDTQNQTNVNHTSPLVQNPTETNIIPNV